MTQPSQENARGDPMKEIDQNCNQGLPHLYFTARGEAPSYANAFAAGLDLAVKTEEPLILPPGAHQMIHTGLSCALPRGYFGLIAIRSGLGSRGLVLSNALGIIDEDYRGEIRIPLFNHGEETIRLENGERIAQMILIPYIQPILEEVDQLEDTERGKEGFGSSGRF